MLESQNPSLTIHLKHIGTPGQRVRVQLAFIRDVESHNPAGFSLFLRKICLLIVTVCHIRRIKKDGVILYRYNDKLFMDRKQPLYYK